MNVLIYLSETLKAYLSKCENSYDLHRCNSWEGDVYSQVKGLEEKGHDHCVVKRLTSSRRDANTSSSIMHDNQKRG